MNAFVPTERRHVRTKGLLAAFVDRFWSWEAPHPVPLPLMLPGGGTELFIHYGAPFAILTADGTLVRLPLAYTSAMRSKSVKLVATGPVGFIAARFRGSCLRHFTSRNTEETLDTFVPAEELLGDALHELQARLAAPSSFAEKARLFESFLEKRRADAKARTEIADALLDKIYYAAPSVSIEDLSAELGFSRRQLERQIRNSSGLSPKQYQKLSRFHHTVKELMLAQRQDYLPIALARGFYDQAHFIHDFNDFAGRPPGEFLTSENFMSHFYNTSLRR